MTRVWLSERKREAMADETEGALSLFLFGVNVDKNRGPVTDRTGGFVKGFCLVEDFERCWSISVCRKQKVGDKCSPFFFFCCLFC